MCVFIIKNKDIYSKFYLTSGWHVLCQEKDQFKAAKMSYFTSIDWYCVSHQPINNAQNILFPDRLSAHSKHKMHINRKRIKSKQPYLQQLCVCFELCSAQQKFKEHQGSYLQEWELTTISSSTGPIAAGSKVSVSRGDVLLSVHSPLDSQTDLQLHAYMTDPNPNKASDTAS